MVINRQALPLPEEVYNPHAGGQAAGQAFLQSLQQEIEQTRLVKAKQKEQEYGLMKEMLGSQYYEPAEGGGVVTPAQLMQGGAMKFRPKTQKPELKAVQDELDAIQKAAKDYGWNDTLRSRFQELGTMLKTGQAYGWAKELGEPLSIKMRRATVAQAKKTDPEFDRLYKEVNTLRQAFQSSGSGTDEENYKSALESFTGYYNAKYPQNAFTTFEEAESLFYGIPIGKKAVAKTLSPTDQSALDWANKNKNSPNPENVKKAKEVFKKLGK